MASPGGVAAGLLGSAASEAAAFAAGLAIGPALAPEIEFLRNEAWDAVRSKALDPATAAAAAAENFASYDAMQQQAAYGGMASALFQYLYDVTLTAPGTGELLTMLRRGTISGADFTHGLRKAKLEPRWDDALRQLQVVLLTPGELANARQQGFIDQARQESEAALQGVTTDRADIQFQLSGLPPGVDVGQRAANRALIDRATFNQIVREGHTKTKYEDLLWEMRHPVLSAPEFATLHLKGWISEQAMNDGGALTGFTPEQMHQLYLARGRPATVHQIHIGYARGGSLAGAADEKDAIQTAVQQSDIRPEYGELLYAGRYTLPTPFVMRTLTQTKVWSEAKAATRLKQAGWIPQDADEAAAAWAGGSTTGAAADPHVTKADNQLWTSVHSSYVKDRTDDAEATTALTLIGVASGAIPEVLARWQAEREIQRAGLSAAQIKKAYSEGTFPKDEATARLVELGWSAADAGVYLGE